MNTHDIELPPLPAYFDDFMDRTKAEIDAHVRAAIEVYRKRRGEPVGYIMPTAIKQLKAGGNAIVGGVSQGFDVPIYTAPQIPEGYKLVPIEPTAEMLIAGDGEFGKRKIYSISGICYKAMLEAAPDPANLGREVEK